MPHHAEEDPMSFSQLASSIAESPTLKLNEEARLLRERGESVIHLGIGEPKNRTPEAAVAAATAVLQKGEVKYTSTDGTPGLKRAILGYTARNYGRTVEPANVIVSSGAKQSLFNLLYALLDPQDEVVLLAPYWVSYPEITRMCRAVPVVVTAADGGFRPTLAEVERALTPRSKALICNSPNNPSGVMYDDDFVAGLVRLCETRGIWLVMDDIYHKLVFDGRRAPSAWSFTTRGIEETKVVLINGVAKTFGMTGFRIGWAVANRALVAVMTNIQSQTTTCSSAVLQAGAEGALNGDPGVIETLRECMQFNRDVTLAGLARITGVRCARPDGTFYCLPDFRAVEPDSVKLSQFLLEKARVVTVPGREFGMEGHLRLSYAGTERDLVDGLARMRWALDPAAPAEIEFGGRRHVRDWTLVA
jgi:aspartate aminotransferase